jgi:hypothetical protein
MEQHLIPSFTWINAMIAVLIAGSFIVFSSLLKEPNRQSLMAIFIGGAGAAYLNGGLGPWEFVFCSLMTYVAYRGLKHYNWIAIGWLLHTGWDIVHHLYANTIVPFSPSSSAGCAICDTILAAWFFMGAPSVFSRLRKPAL